MTPSLLSLAWRGLVSAAFAAFLLAWTPAAARAPSLVPAPLSVTPKTGEFTLDARTEILIPAGDAGARRAADYLAGLLGRTRGLTPKVREGDTASAHAIVFRRDGARTGVDAYALDVGPGGAVVSASGDGGLLYGAVTVWQLATQRPGSHTIPAVAVEDAPRFVWRGLMLDSARHFQSVEFVKAFIDQMAVHKLNVLHWHLTDDQAWRLEIRKYPRLTGVASCRVPAGAGQTDIDPATGKPRQYCGFYTQAQVRELVAYAAARNITIVPEIDMPGHAQAAVVAYPEIGAGLTAPTEIKADWGVFPYLYNVDDKTMGFAKDVLGEVIELFPSPYIHVGGDEAVKDQWKANPAIQAKMKALGVKDEHEMQSWFVQQLGTYLQSKGRRLIGWDEILEGGLAPDATVMSWRGLEGAVAAAKLGHDTVLSPWPLLYMDNRQSASADEGPGRGRVVTPRDIYAFDPAPEAMTAEERRHVLGVQANLWTEHMRTEGRVWHQAWPRASALSEIAWTDEGQRSWDGFAARLPGELHRLEALGVPADLVPFEPQLTATPTGKGATVELSTAVGVSDIRFTLDGSEPTLASPSFTKTAEVTVPTVVRAQSFLDGRALGAPRQWTVDARSLATRISHQLELCSDKLVLALEDDAPIRGDRAVFLIDIMQPCWRWPQADLTGVTRIELAVGQVPFNFQIGKAVEEITFRPPSTPAGELEVRAGGCEGERIASIPLGAAAGNSGVSTISGAIKPMAGKQDLCFTFTATGVEPMWAIDRVTLVTPAVAAIEPRT